MTARLDYVLSKFKKVKQLSNGSYQALCPCHDDKTASLSIDEKDETILMFCHAGCEIENIATHTDLDMKNLFPPKENNNGRQQKIIDKYDYLGYDGKLLYQVLRYDDKSFKQRRPGSDGEWIWNLKGVTPVPYRLPDIIKAKKSGRVVFIVEGEKDVHTLEKHGFCATCNSGGAGKFKKLLVPYFKDANVVPIPDNDDPGRKHTEDVATKLNGTAKKIRLLNLPNLEEKQDVSDWLKHNSAEDLKKLVKETADWKKAKPLKSLKTRQKPEISIDALDKAPFKCLGVDNGHCYYLSNETQQIIRLSANNHTAANLIFLAKLQYWERSSFANENGGVYWKAAQNALFRQCSIAGIYDPGKVRGCGAWFDEGRTVLHLGNRLRVDGKIINIPEFKTNSIYEARKSTEMTDENPLSQPEAIKFSQICEKFSWEKPISARLLAGWCVIAPISGALFWRPHIWITGSKGSGKSWIQNNVVRKVLGNVSLFVQSNTTEAGIRQTLRNNSFPVVFDEADTDTQPEEARLQKIIDLMRQASSEGSAGIIKGTQTGEAMSFRIRSCFLLAAVNPKLKHSADISRITIMGLNKIPHSVQKEQFKKVFADIVSTLTSSYCTSFRARSFSMIPVIRKNAEIFAGAVATIMDEQRAGDQLGALLAGCYRGFVQQIVS